MTNFIPLFPLSIVVYPGEELNLHIFEPRYKQLIKDCHEAKKPFGIPTVLNNQVMEYGCLVEIVEITNTHTNGEMDIKTRGTLVFKILEKIQELPKKLYHGAIVTYPPTKYIGSLPLMQKVLEGIKELHTLLDVQKTFKKSATNFISFDMAHHAGMTLEEEYQLLELEQELHRQEFIKIHIAKMLAVMREMNLLKTKIKLNGHFRNLEGFRF